MTKSPANFVLSLAALALLAQLQATPAAADLLTRVWVSNTGSDTGLPCGPITAPCRTFRTATFLVAAGGEVGVLNSGDYGSFDVTKSLSFTNDGAGEAAVTRLADDNRAILINAGVGDIVSLRGLVIDGGVAGGIGIAIGQVTAVHVQNCVIKNFEGGGNASGIHVIAQNNVSLFVSDTIIYNNGNFGQSGGILLFPEVTGSVNVVLDRVHLENNVFGLFVTGRFGTGNGAHVVIRDSVIAGNISDGIQAISGSPGFSPAFILVERTSVVNNGGTGILADGPHATILLKENTISRNGAGISAVNSGQLISHGNNTNTNNIGPEGAPTSLFAQM